MEFCFSVGCHVLLTSTIVLRQCVMSHDVHFLGSWQNELPWWMQSVSAGKLLGKNHGALLWRCEFGGVRSFFSSDWTIVACLNYHETSWASITWIQTLYLYKKKSLYNFASGPLPGVWLALLLCSLINVVSSAYRLWSNANWLIKEIHIWGLCQCAKHICLRKVELEAGKV